MGCRDIAGCPGPPPQHHFQQAAPGQLQILLRTRTADCRTRKRQKTLRHYHCMSRSDLLARTDCGPSAAALSSRCRYAHQWESISRWIYAAAQPGNTSYRHLRRARRRRRRQGRYSRGRRLFPRRIDQARRPLPVADRTALGTGRRIWSVPPGQGALLSCKERKSSFLLPARVENKMPPRARRSCRACVSCHRPCCRR